VFAFAVLPMALAFDSGGTISTRIRVAPDGSLLDFHDSAMVEPWVQARPDSRVTARGALSLRMHPGTNLTAFEDADSAATVLPLSLRLTDAWLMARHERTHLKLGVQRIPWGVGTGISVVDTVNPWDLSNPTRFDQRLSVPAAQLVYARESVSAEFVTVPVFVPSLMPSSGVDLLAGGADLFDAESTGAGDLEINSMESRLSVPGTDVLSGSVAGRLRFSGARMDAALLWYHGIDSLPQVSGEVVLTGFQTDTGRVDVGVPMAYPEVDVGGLTVKGALFSDITGWVEVSVVLPSETSATASQSQLEALQRLGTIETVPDPLPVTVTQDGQPYFRWLTGVDRFLGPVYLNVQWLHGFPTERQQSELSDYGLVLIRYTVTPTVRLSVHGVSDGEGWLSGGEIALLYADNLELDLGVTLVGSSGTLGDFSGIGHGTLGATMVF